MRSLLTDDLVNQFDNWLAKYLLSMIVVVMASFLLITLAISVLLIPEYAGYEICVSLDCFGTLAKLAGPQIEVIKAGAATVSIIVVVAGVYLAMRTYLATSQVGMLGNAIAHITFYEKFVASEISRRNRMAARYVDVFAIYTLMFPSGNASQRFASADFSKSVEAVYEVVSESSRRYRSRENVFKFDDHRRRMIESLKAVHITLEPIPRVDFLEVEDEVLDFISMLSRVFAPPGVEALAPQRAYR